MFLNCAFGLALALVVTLPVDVAAAGPAVAEQKGTVIAIQNDTDRAMSFFVEFATYEGRQRHFLSGKYLKPGETARFTAESEYTIHSRRKGDDTYFLIRVRAFRGRLESLQWKDIENENPDHWWGGNRNEITGLKCRDWEENGYTHLSARLHW